MSLSSVLVQTDWPRQSDWRKPAGLCWCWKELRRPAVGCVKRNSHCPASCTTSVLQSIHSLSLRRFSATCLCKNMGCDGSFLRRHWLIHSTMAPPPSCIRLWTRRLKLFLPMAEIISASCRIFFLDGRNYWKMRSLPYTSHIILFCLRNLACRRFGRPRDLHTVISELSTREHFLPDWRPILCSH